jgi:ATP-dependent RNA helicase RhlE
LRFSDLNISKPLQNALDDLDLLEPTPIQAACFSPILAGRDIVAIARTGTGKTISYLLPILRNLKYSEQKHPRVLILVPTRELVVQVIDELEKLTSYQTVRIKGVYGGTNINTQKQDIHEGADVVVATPGRLLDLALSGVLRLKKIQQLVIDEVDAMLDLGFRTQLTNIFDILPERRQNLMFSATLTEEVDQIIKQFYHLAERIEVAQRESPTLDIEVQLYELPNFHTKMSFLYRLIKENQFEKSLVVVATKKPADEVFELLNPNEEEESNFAIIHSNKSQNYRLRSIEDFDSGKVHTLIATDIVSRGLDFTDVSHVINFDIPESEEDFTHRIGRTARAGKSGVVISLITDFETEKFERIKGVINGPINLCGLPEDLEISDIFTSEERPNLGDKNYLPGK